jgi:hypothetical protein
MAGLDLPGLFALAVLLAGVLLLAMAVAWGRGHG